MLIGLHLSKVFEENGYRARAIKSGEDCLDRIEAGDVPDLILMDINLGSGRLDGPETTRRINENRDLPVVLHSAYTDRETLLPAGPSRAAGTPPRVTSASGLPDTTPRTPICAAFWRKSCPTMIGFPKV